MCSSELVVHTVPGAETRTNKSQPYSHAHIIVHSTPPPHLIYAHGHAHVYACQPLHSPTNMPVNATKYC